MFYEDNISGFGAEEETKNFMARVLQDIEQYYSSEEGVLELAEFMARFSNYSARNMQVIKSQFPNAYVCANLKTFKKAGFSLKDGEKEMGIFHPRIKEYVRDPKTKQEVLVTDLTSEQKRQVKVGDLKVKKDITYYLKKTALDISQTTANMDDLKRIFPNRQLNFEVSEENKDMLIAGIKEAAKKEKIESGLLVENTDILQIDKVPKVIQDLVNEKLQSEKGKDNKDNLTVEFETKLTSHVICNHYGIDIVDSTAPYISKWIQGDQDFEEKDSSIKRVHETARTFINTIDQKISELQNEVGKEINNKKLEMNLPKESAKSLSNPEDMLDENPTVNTVEDKQKILERIQGKAERSVSNNVGLNFADHWSDVSQIAAINTQKRWEGYKIHLSEDGKFIEDIQPNMILSLGELNTIVDKFGTEEEHGKLEVIKNEIKPHYEDDLEEKEFLKTLVAKVTVDQHENMKVECISEFVDEDQCNFDFTHSISEAIESINHSIIEAHKEVMNEEVENKIAPIQYIEEKNYQDGDIRFNPLDGISNDYEDEVKEEVYQMESAKTVGSVKKGHGAMQVKESKVNTSAGKRYLGKDTVHHEEHSHVSQDRERARRQHMIRQRNGRDY